MKEKLTESEITEAIEVVFELAKLKAGDPKTKRGLTTIYKALNMARSANENEAVLRGAGL